MRLLSWLAVNTLALAVATWLLDGISMTGSSRTDEIVQMIIVGAIFGVITAFIRPIVNFISIPLIILTLGLMLLVVNALMLLLTSKVAEWTDLGFHVDGFWTALWGSIIISISSVVLEALMPSSKRR
jgi:putative membrane protein